MEGCNMEKKTGNQNSLPQRNSELSDEDKKWVDEYLNGEERKSVNVNGSVNATRKLSVKSELNLSKHDVDSLISKLKTCTYKTPPKEVASYLETLFSRFPSKNGHWSYIAQHYTPRAINRVIQLMLKQQVRGDKKVKNASAYFTYLIQLRKKRRSLQVPLVAVKEGGNV